MRVYKKYMTSNNKKYTKTLQKSYKPDFKINALLMCDTATGVMPIRQESLKPLNITKTLYINNHINTDYKKSTSEAF